MAHSVEAPQRVRDHPEQRTREDRVQAGLLTERGGAREPRIRQFWVIREAGPAPRDPGLPGERMILSQTIEDLLPRRNPDAAGPPFLLCEFLAKASPRLSRIDAAARWRVLKPRGMC